MLFIHIIIHFTPYFFNSFTGKNVHVPPKLSTAGQKTLSTFVLANLLFQLFTITKSILLLA